MLRERFDIGRPRPPGSPNPHQGAMPPKLPGERGPGEPPTNPGRPTPIKELPA